MRTQAGLAATRAPAPFALTQQPPTTPSPQDLYLFDLFDLHRRKFGDRVDGLYPGLAAHAARVAALPGVAAYLASDRRLEQ